MLSADDVQRILQKTVEREETLGMTVFISGQPRRVPVSLKTLYSDFIVRELSPLYNNGLPLVLEKDALGLATEKAFDPQSLGEKRPRCQDDKEETSSIDYDAVAAAFSDTLSEKDLHVLLEGLKNGSEKMELVELSDRAARTRVHQLVRSHLGQTHVSSTDEGVLCIKKANAANRREEKRRSNPVRSRAFTHFTLYKENIDSNQAIRWLAASLSMSARQVLFGGTKDKRAVTLQRMAIRGVDKARLLALNKKRSAPNTTIKISGVTEESVAIGLGDANGNHFEIVLRLQINGCASVESLAADVSAVEAAIRHTGVINYFGTQRFGTTSILTSDIGVAMLGGSLERAVTMIIESKSMFVPALKQAVEHMHQHDYEQALAATPHFCHLERDVLKHLANAPNDWSGALRVLPRTVGMLYVHAVQSLVWNRVVSRRLAGGRLRPEVGDLVLLSTYDERLRRRDAQAPLVGLLKHSGDGGAHDPLPAVRLLSETDPLECFHLSDVLLPLPGPDKNLQFPLSASCTRDDYVSVIAELGIENGLLNDAGALAKVFHFYGTYRNVCVRPADFSLSVIPLTSWRQQVVQTDLEKLQEAFPAASTSSTATESTEVPSLLPPSSENEAPTPTNLQALVAKFSLPSGSYATSVLREFCVTVSEEFHAKPANSPSDANANADDEAHDIPDGTFGAEAE